MWKHSHMSQWKKEHNNMKELVMYVSGSILEWHMIRRRSKQWTNEELIPSDGLSIDKKQIGKNDAGFQQISLGTGLAELNPKYFCGFSQRLSPSFFPNVQMWGGTLYWKESPIFSCTLHCNRLRSVILFFPICNCSICFLCVHIKVPSFKSEAHILAIHYYIAL